MNHIPVCQPCCSPVKNSFFTNPERTAEITSVCMCLSMGCCRKLGCMADALWATLRGRWNTFLAQPVPRRKLFCTSHLAGYWDRFPHWVSQTCALVSDGCSWDSVLMECYFTAALLPMSGTNDCSFSIILSGNWVKQQFPFPLVTLCTRSQSAPGVLGRTLRATATTAVPGYSKEMCIACALWGSVVGKLKQGGFLECPNSNMSLAGCCTLSACYL